MQAQCKLRIHAVAGHDGLAEVHWRLSVNPLPSGCSSLVLDEHTHLIRSRLVTLCKLAFPWFKMYRQDRICQVVKYDLALKKGDDFWCAAFTCLITPVFSIYPHSPPSPCPYRYPTPCVQKGLLVSWIRRSFMRAKKSNLPPPPPSSFPGFCTENRVRPSHPPCPPHRQMLTAS